MSREDREIDRLTRALAALEKGDHWPMTAGELARWNANLARGCVQVVRGKSTGRADSAMDNVVGEAKARITGELAAMKAVRDEAAAEKAKAKAKRRAESSWW